MPAVSKHYVDSMISGITWREPILFGEELPFKPIEGTALMIQEENEFVLLIYDGVKWEIMGDCQDTFYQKVKDLYLPPPKSIRYLKNLKEKLTSIG